MATNCAPRNLPRTGDCPVIMLLCFMVAIGILLASGTVHAETVISIRSSRSFEDKSYDYYVNLLKLALKKTEAEYGPFQIQVKQFTAPQGRALKELASIGHSISVDWAGTNTERERLLLPIRIPLIKGLLGYRVPVIRKQDLPLFERVKSIESLKMFTALQGSHWPDATILKNAGLKVHKVTHFKQMYPMLKAGRVDYLPRGINEVYSEVEEADDGDLLAYDDLLIRYHLPMYFFTNKDNEKLAKRIEKGLRMAISDGTFRRFMRTSPVTAPLFPLSKYDDSRILTIENPDLPKETPLDDASLWTSLGTVKTRK